MIGRVQNVPSGSTADGDALQLQKNFPHTVTVQTVNLPQLLGLGTSKVRFLIVDSTSTPYTSPSHSCLAHTAIRHENSMGDREWERVGMALGSADADWNSYAQWRELGVAVEGCPMMAVNLRKIFNSTLPCTTTDWRVCLAVRSCGPSTLMKALPRYLCVRGGALTVCGPLALRVCSVLGQCAVGDGPRCVASHAEDQHQQCHARHGHVQSYAAKGLVSHRTIDRPDYAPAVDAADSFALA